MTCRSCGLGPKKIYRSTAKPKVEAVTPTPHPAKGIIDTTKKKTSVPTRSPARTFKTLGD